jgi:PKHD-type hydroxylase
VGGFRHKLEKLQVTITKEKEGALREDILTGLLSSNKRPLGDPETWPSPYSHETLAKTLFTPEECSKIIRIGLDLSLVRAGVVIDGVSRTRLRARNSRISRIVHDDGTHWIFQTIATAIAEANSARWHYELKRIDRLQFTEYGFGAHYDWHVDVGPGKNITRKLSFSVQLSARATYFGGQLQFRRGRFRRTASYELGSITIFPSFMSHRVSPLLFGKRYSLVGWVHGAEPLR